MKIKLLLLSCILIFGLGTSVGAMTLTYTDMRFGGEYNYILDIETTAAQNVYSVDFTISIVNAGTGTWYADWFAIKFDGNASTVLPRALNAWTAWDSLNNTAIWGGKDPTDPPDRLQEYNSYYNVTRPKGGHVGYYLTVLDQTVVGDETGYTSGINLTTGGEHSFSFFVTVPGGLNLLDPLLAFPFQVGFYDGVLESDNIQTARLSETLSVSEPSTLLLLGTGLTIVALWGRRRFKGRS